MAKRVRLEVVRTPQSIDGRHAVGVGARLGFWPCLGGPYVQVSLGTRRYELWYGRPSYLHG
jgi:hypothetical protein